MNGELSFLSKIDKEEFNASISFSLFIDSFNNSFTYLFFTKTKIIRPTANLKRSGRIKRTKSMGIIILSKVINP